LISDSYWRRRFARDPAVIGKVVRIGQGISPIVGVMPSTFLFPDRGVDLWFPSQIDAPYAQSRRAAWYHGVGRLKDGVSLEQARADLEVVQARLGSQYPDTDRNIGIELDSLKEAAVGGVRRSLWLLFGAVSVLLLIACTNIAALLLARAAHRQEEVSVRLRLGASPGSVVAQMFAETMLLALTGAGVGLFVAAAASAAFRSAAVNLPRVDEITLDARVLLYTLLTAIAVAFVCGVLPALRMARREVTGALNQSSRTQVSSRHSVQWLLVGMQVALSVTLLAGAALLVRSLYELSRVNPGFDTGRVLSFRMSGSWAETMDYGALLQRVDATLEVLRAMPGVEGAASTGWTLPGVPTAWQTEFELVEARGATDQRLVAEARAVSPEYFATMRIPVLAGELCGRPATKGSSVTAAQAMVNRSFAAAYFPGRGASLQGRHLQHDPQAPATRITGIVGDARERGLDRDPGPTVYWCMSASSPTPYFLVRTTGEPLGIAQAVRLKMKELEPTRAVYDMAPLETQIGEAFTENRLRTILLAMFAATALSLACVGLYGTLSYIVSLRRREVGLRLALGAGRGDIVIQFLRQGLTVVGLACAGGLALSLAFTRVLSGMLYGVSPSDPVTLSSVLAAVLSIAAIAALVPATRAALLPPMQALREE
jgi:putative ABC transport system permease protein